MSHWPELDHVPIPDKIIGKKNKISLKAIRPSLGAESRNQLSLRCISEQQVIVDTMGKKKKKLLERKKRRNNIHYNNKTSNYDWVSVLQFKSVRVKNDIFAIFFLMSHRIRVAPVRKTAVSKLVSNNCLKVKAPNWWEYWVFHPMFFLGMNCIYFGSVVFASLEILSSETGEAIPYSKWPKEQCILLLSSYLNCAVWD